MRIASMNAPAQNDGMPGGDHAARWFRRLTVAGFSFFLVKGLLWIALAVWAVS